MLDFHNLSALTQDYGHNTVQASSETHLLPHRKTKIRVGQQLLQVDMIESNEASAMTAFPCTLSGF